MITALAPIRRYEKAAAVPKQAFEEGETVREIALRNKVLPEEDIDKLMDEARHGTFPASASTPAFARFPSNIHFS